MEKSEGTTKVIAKMRSTPYQGAEPFTKHWVRGEQVLEEYKYSLGGVENFDSDSGVQEVNKRILSGQNVFRNTQNCGRFGINEIGKEALAR